MDIGALPPQAPSTSFFNIAHSARTTLHTVLASQSNSVETTGPMYMELRHLERSLGDLAGILPSPSDDRDCHCLGKLAAPLRQSASAGHTVQKMTRSIDRLRHMKQSLAGSHTLLSAAELICAATVQLCCHPSACRHTKETICVRKEKATDTPPSQASSSRIDLDTPTTSHRPHQNSAKVLRLCRASGVGCSSKCRHRRRHSHLARYRHICWEGPAKFLDRWKNSTFSLVSSSASALVGIGQLIRWWRRSRRLDICMSQGTRSSWQELVDCAGWVLVQPSNGGELPKTLREKTLPRDAACHGCGDRCIDQRGSTKDKEVVFRKMFPEDAAYRHFARRGAFCFVSSFRPMTPTELYEAAITKVLDSDIDWPSDCRSLIGNL